MDNCINRDLSISIVVPVYNESEVVSIFTTEVKRVMAILGQENYEVIFVNDGSEDTTLQELLSLRASNNCIKILSFSRNFGQQAAIAAGYQFSQNNLILTMDVDLQHPVEFIPIMVEKAKEGFDIIFTARINEAFSFKTVSSKMFYKFLELFSPGLVHVGTSDFRLITREVMNELLKFKEFDTFYRGLVPYLGFRQIVIPYTPNQRKLGRSKYSFRKMIQLGLSGMTSFSTLPLHLSTILGFVISFVAFLYLCYALFIKFYLDIAISGWTSIIISILFIGGVQLFILGIMGSYLGKIFFEVKNRPKFIINQKIGF